MGRLKQRAASGGLGGAVGHLGSITWVRLFDLRSARAQALERFGMAAWRLLARPALSVLQAIASRLPATSLRVEDPLTQVEELTPQALLEYLPAVAEHRRLRPDYDKRFLTWLFREMVGVRSRGEMAKRLVRDRDGRVVG